MSRLDPVSLRLFVKVVETGTIAAAAQAEHVSSTAVSKRLSELESVLQTPLLSRTNKGVEPTSAGVALLRLARGALHELDQIWSEMENFSSGVRGIVRVCASMSAITQFLAEPLKTFIDKYPEVELQLEEKTSSLVAKAVAENAADVGVYLPIVQEPELEVFPYRSDRLVAIVPKGHSLARRKSIALRELLGFDIVGLHTGSAINFELARVAQSVQKPLNLRIQVTSLDALSVMVSTGLGVGVMPEWVARRQAKTTPLQIIELTDESAHRHFRVGVRRVDALPTATRLLLDHLLRGC